MSDDIIQLIEIGAIGLGAYWLITKGIPMLGSGTGQAISDVGSGIGSGVGSIGQNIGSGVGTGIQSLGQGAGTGIDQFLGGVGQGVYDLFANANPFKITTAPAKSIQSPLTNQGYAVAQPAIGQNVLQFQNASANTLPSVTSTGDYYIGGSSTITGGVGISTMAIPKTIAQSTPQQAAKTIASNIAPAGQGAGVYHEPSIKTMNK
jgi:phage-related protein